MLLNSLAMFLVLGAAADKDLEKLQGTWQVEKLIGKGGKEVPAENAKKIRFVIEGDSLKRLVNGVDRKDPATIKVDASKNPAQIDLTSGNAPVVRASSSSMATHLSGASARPSALRNSRAAKAETTP
jgi:uncharacterized protein (TIGR03067 family)